MPLASALVAGALVLSACSGTTEAPTPRPSRVAAEGSQTPTAEPSVPPAPQEVRAGTAFKIDQAARRRAEAEVARKKAARVAARQAKAAAANPLAGREWGVYRGPAEQAWQPYLNASGETKELLGEIVNTPKAGWFGAWIPDDVIAARVRDYIDNSQAGDPEALVQMAVFRMEPWEHEACRRLPSERERASYRTWIDRFAATVGSTPTAIVLQPDGPFSLCAPGGPAVPASLIAYASRAFSALPNTSVYIEIGSADWPAPGQGGVPEVLKFLLPAGVEEARGIALNGTHYNSVESDIARGAEVVEALAARGITGKKVVLNTSNNGNPFDFGTYSGPDPDNAFVCNSSTDARTCVTLGIPPTTDVANQRWGLPEQARQDARQYVDAYLWFGRPWLYRQNQPFVMERAVGLVRSSPY